MSAFLNDVLTTGFIEKLDGDDGRVSKMEKASSAVAAELKADPPLLIGAVLAGMDPDVPPDDPAVVRAERALVAEWRSLSSVFPDKPVNWYRAILLDACASVGEERLSAVLWLAAADHLPQVRLGREEPAVRALVLRWAEACEGEAMKDGAAPTAKKPTPPKLTAAAPVPAVAARNVDRNTLIQRVGASAGPNYRNTAGPNPNPHWSNQAQSWSWEFTDRMAALLADELDAVGADVMKRLSDGFQHQATAQTAFVSEVQNAFETQRKWLESAHQSALAQREVASTQLEALWWAEALYSPVLRRSYREVSPVVAAFLMAKDLHELMPSPAPASVGYLLAEAVGRLPGAGHNHPVRFTQLLTELRAARTSLPPAYLLGGEGLRTVGRLGLRDLVLLAAGEREFLIGTELARSPLREDPELTLPQFAHAIFRQEQAVEIAGGRK
ncbi:MAG: GTPase-associated system all-helical protein GASH [Pseudomonadota bacterium]|nr:GTPase-associated system all-helical protein GASH [Pseudomonadota bacterium]